MNREIEAYIGLGSNLGDREAHLDQGRKALAKVSTTPLIASPLYQSPSLGVEGLPDFLNQVVKIETKLPPFDLLCYLKGTELLLGRQKRAKWHSREIDMDILLYGEKSLELPYFQVPHKQMTQRQFVLKPLLDLNHRLVEPGSKFSYADALRKLVTEEGHQAEVYQP